MNISLLTIWHIGNYGAELQTYCTVQVLKKMGCNVKVIRYDLRDLQNNKKSVKTILFRTISLFAPASIKAQFFWLSHIPCTRHYRDIKTLYTKPPKADIYIVGSDQVWNPEITKESALLYFLDFVRSGQKKISYASSFGTEKWKASIELTSVAKKNLQTFSNVSCREKSGVSILNDVFGIQAQCVLDPTLLVDNYREIIGNLKTKPVLLYYPLSQNPDVETFCKKLAVEIGLSYKLANKRIILGKYFVWNKPSVVQWLRNIGQASFIITPSFHGLTTSINLHRNFAILVTEPIILKRSARIKDLLEELSLSDRFFTSIEDLYSSRIWEKEIDYNLIDSKLKILRRESLDFLKNSLL